MQPSQRKRERRRYAPVRRMHNAEAEPGKHPLPNAEPEPRKQNTHRPHSGRRTCTPRGEITMGSETAAGTLRPCSMAAERHIRNYANPTISVTGLASAPSGALRIFANFRISCGDRAFPFQNDLPFSRPNISRREGIPTLETYPDPLPSN